MSEERKPEIKYKMPEININIDENNIKNNSPKILDKLFDNLENIENIRNQSLIMTEISNSRINLNQSSTSKINNSVFLLHNGVQCEKCKECPIMGHRYKCPKCLNYNLCEKCEEDNGEMGFHPHSDFILYRIPETPLTSNDFSYDCLTKDLEIHKNIGIESFDIKLKLKNSGYLEWPESSYLKCRKELSTIFCEKCKLPSIKMNEETDVDLKFNKCNKIPKGTYTCYVNCIIEDKIRRGPIIIKVFIE